MAYVALGQFVVYTVLKLAQQSANLQAALRQKEEEFASIKQRSLELTVALEQARQVAAGTSSIGEISAIAWTARPPLHSSMHHGTLMCLRRRNGGARAAQAEGHRTDATSESRRSTRLKRRLAGACLGALGTAHAIAATRRATEYEIRDYIAISKLIT